LLCLGEQGRQKKQEKKKIQLIDIPGPHLFIRISLADAERLAIRRLKSRATAHSALVPGQPLPPSHPSPSLLAKLYLNVHALYDDARSLIDSSSSTSSNSSGWSKYKLKLGSKDDDHVASPSSPSSSSPSWSPSSALKEYATTGRQRAAASAYMWLGVDAAEKSSNVGEAVAWLQLAKASGAGSESSSSSLSSLPKRKAAADAAVSNGAGAGPDELGNLDEFVNVYRRLNDKVRSKRA
jgi:hypothetical protein